MKTCHITYSWSKVIKEEIKLLTSEVQRWKALESKLHLHLLTNLATASSSSSSSFSVVCAANGSSPLIL